MKSLKRNTLLIGIFILSGVFIYSAYSQKPKQKFKKIQKYMDAATQDKLAGVVIYINSKKHGKWIGTSGYSNLENKTPIGKDAIFSLASIGKMYNAVAVLKLVEEGKLGLDDKIEKYLPKEIIEGIPNAKQSTIRHLLGHTSGMCNYNSNPILNELYLSGNLKLDTLSKMDALRTYAYGDTKNTTEFGKYRYSSTNYLLLTMIVDSILPEGHEAYLRNLLAEHGLNNTFYKQTPTHHLVDHYGDLNHDASLENLSAETVETTNWYSGDDGVYASVEEAAVFLKKLMKAEILNEATLKEMMTWDNEKHPDYGLGLMVDKGFPYKMLVGHSGRGIGITTDLYHFPKQDMEIVIFCNTGLRGGPDELGDAYYPMRRKIMKKLFLF